MAFGRIAGGQRYFPLNLFTITKYEIPQMTNGRYALPEEHTVRFLATIGKIRLFFRQLHAYSVKTIFKAQPIFFECTAKTM